MTDRYFDRSGQIPRPPYRRLLRELRALLFDHPAAPDARELPPGDQHVVLVIPAFLTGDAATASFRRFLQRCGFRAEGWQLGINWGPTASILAGLQRRLTDLRELEGGPVSVVGVSLGGLLARDLALSRPRDVRQVITMVSPWRLPTASTIEPLVHLAARFYSPSVNFARLRGPLPVPATSVYTRDDGIVAWQSCRDADESCDNGTAVEVRGAHATICRNPQAIAVVVERLAHGAPPPAAITGR